MSSLAFLVTELQSLASETRRKHPDIREASEKALSILRASPEQASASLVADGLQTEDLLSPIFMGCSTKNAKIVAISLGSLQRLIALKAVPPSQAARIVGIMSDAMSQGVDIQLRILQTLVSLIMNFKGIHGEQLGDALLLCFKLVESRIAVVSSTAAATLRQLVMFVVDKMVDEDRLEIEPEEAYPVDLPDGTSIQLHPSAYDSFSVLSDLCLLANSEAPSFLKLSSLPKTFALELIESVLTNYHASFRTHPELILLLRHHLCPLLLKSLSSRPLFPLTLRCTRVVFILLKQFSAELVTEAEVFLTLLIRIISSPSDLEDNPVWMRVLAMEIMRGLCSDAELMRNVWERYEGEDTGNEAKSKVFTSLITALNRLVTEKPALLGVSQQMLGVNVSNDATTPGGAGSGSMAGMVANAAVGVASMMSSGNGLSLQTSAMKLQCIDQLDKADAPPIPEAYIYLLAVQCLVSLCEGFTSFTGPLYTQYVIQKPRTAGDAPNRAPAALDLSTLPESSTTSHLYIVRSIIASGWPALLAALSFVLSTNLSTDLFVDVLAAHQAMANVSGMLGLTTPRDAFLTSLAKLAVPPRVLSALETYDAVPQTPRSTVAEVAENFGLSAATGPPGLSERNILCLKIFLASVMFLAGSLGASWYSILEVVQNAEYVLTLSPLASNAPTGIGSPKKTRTASVMSSPPSSSPRHPMMNDLDPDAILALIQRLFDASKNLDDAAFRDFVDALCRLSGEMVEMRSGSSIGHMSSTLSVSSASESQSEDSASVPSMHHRRVSGIYVKKLHNSRGGSGDFGITRLGDVAKLNLSRLIYHSPDIAWDRTTSHLLLILSVPSAPQAIRLQAARVLDGILQTVPRNLGSTGDLKAVMQERVLHVLRQQVIPNEDDTGITITGVEVRKMGLETLHEILQSSGHTLVVGWEIIFEMLESVCKLSTPVEPESSGGKLTSLGLGLPSGKSLTSLVKIAFQSLTLVCDSITALSSDQIRLCIRTLGQFGKQSDTNIALTAAASLLWSVSDTIQGKRKDQQEEESYSDLWMFLLLEILGLCTDGRQEVRDGAIQTLFRAIKLYGGTLSLQTWDECVWKVTFPLLGALNEFEGEGYEESKILALQSIAGIIHDFLLEKLIKLERFSEVWDGLVAHVEAIIVGEGDHSRKVAVAALRCAEKTIKAASNASLDGAEKERAQGMYERVWAFFQVVGDIIVERQSRPFTQESLVAFVELIQRARSLSRLVEGHEWPVEMIQRLLILLKGVLTYPHSPDYRPDVDALPPVQSVVLETVNSIDLSVPSAPSLVIRDLAEYATLAFLASFDAPEAPTRASSSAPKKRITYIALTKKIMPALVELLIEYRLSRALYVDGTLESVLACYAIPVKLKYDCPASSKYDSSKVPPLWKTATTCFLRVVKEVSGNVSKIEQQEPIPASNLEGIWRQILDVYRGGILADCSPALSFSLSEQFEEESFDLALVSSLEIDVVPHVGDPRLPDSLVSLLGSVLEKGSKLYSDDEDMPLGTHNLSGFGSTDSGKLLPREQFSFWCFDLLFLICSSITKDSRERPRRRLAALSLPSLLRRCGNTMKQYVADESIRGNLPFTRAREDELVYILRKLETLRLWDGCLWAAMSENPSELSTPPFDNKKSPSQIIADAVKCSSVAHLFYFYTIICDIASIPRSTPVAWVANGSQVTLRDDNASYTHVERVDARDVARRCLRAMGQEMSIPL
ncbi:hypothetical protein CYLTODRAFT_422528 [Cylindrobasidium torrendii FP15055 ss-10]|uniref:Protein MON2 homolog n=1 Tax=Cylindrobasidium torrendii FP15055 ss-10 TaxID=1314674 RepID=A0A0D7BA83_9AGAR|nr:hypothetical protein CYLTODRAFT_422528 [Cylindrobasidium torrendii FP15055 ss-10]